MVKHADLMVCDSKNIEKYIRGEYTDLDPETTFIAYGADIKRSALADDDPKFTDGSPRRASSPSATTWLWDASCPRTTTRP
mgnify:FL=1